MTPHMRVLLAKAALAYAEGRDPFSAEWLIENRVTGDECIDLSILISATIDYFLLITAHDEPLRRRGGERNAFSS